MTIDHKNRPAIWTVAAVVLAILLFSPFVVSFIKGFSQPPVSFRVAADCTSDNAFEAPKYSERFIEDLRSDSVQVHSASVTQLSDSDLLAVWFEGSAEGASDVAIHASRWRQTEGLWSPTEIIMDRDKAEVGTSRSVKKIGNPSLFTDSFGRTWLFFVTVALGGWSGSELNYTFSDDSGNTWSSPKRLTTAVMPHSGTLVRSPAFEFSDGSIGIPAYREYGKFGYPKLIRITRDGRVLETGSTSNGLRGVIQPWTTVIDERRAISFLRDKTGKNNEITMTKTEDGGSTWTSPVSTGLPNPDSAVSSLRLPNGKLLMAFNNSVGGRNDLALAISSDLGNSWRTIHQIETGSEPIPDGDIREYSYPTLFQDCSGNIHLIYTWNRRKIKHVIFNSSWIEKLDG